MQPNCATENGRLQFLAFFRQRRRKILFRRDPTLEPGPNPVDDLTCDEASDRGSIGRRIENGRSRLGWGITHI